MRKTTLIVDGYNAINAIHEVKKVLNRSLLDARSRIIVLAAEYVRSSGYITDFCVIFDGQDRYRYLERIHVPRDARHTFSATGEGDEKIIDTIRIYSEKGRVVVASNDNYVRNNARGYGASLIYSEDLAGKNRYSEKQKGQIEKDKEIDKHLKEKITKEYMEELGL